MIFSFLVSSYNMAHFFSKRSNWLYITLLVLLIHTTFARPGNFEEFGSQPHENRCKKGDLTVTEVCQRCAKQTKSNIVYPMCCVNEDDVYNWCGKYINYGKMSKRWVETTK